MKQSKDIEKATSSAINTWFETPKLVSYYSKKHLKDLKKYRHRKSAFDRAWRRYCDENIKQWIKPERTMIPQMPETDKKQSPLFFSRRIATAESPKLQFKVAGLKERSTVSLTRLVPDNIRNEIALAQARSA